MARIWQSNVVSLKPVAGIVLAAGLATLLGGCEDPAARERIARREQNMQRTARLIQEIDAAEPRAMGWALEAMREQHQLDLQHSAENPAKVNALIEEDAQWFRDSQPLYRAEIETQLGGKPESIERTLHEILY